MCARGDGVPGGSAEALAMLASSLDYLGHLAQDGELQDVVLGEVLLGLEAAGAKQAAVRSSVLSRFDAGNCHDADAYQTSASWLRDRAGMTRSAALRQMKQARALRARPRLAAAMAEGRLSESYLDKIVARTKKVPADMLDATDEAILSVLAAGGDVDYASAVIEAVLKSAHAQDQQDPDPDEPDDDFEDRSLCLETTLGGAGILRGDLTPEAAAALHAVLESLGKKQGREDTRSQGQRDHDALLDALHRLLGARMLPDRAGSDTRAEVHIPFSELMDLPGAETLTEAWLRGAAGEPGWLLGKDAETAACDALISPIVMAAPDWDVAAEIVSVVLDALGQHQDVGEGRQPIPLPPEAWTALLQAVGRLAIRFVSGPGAIASLLRTGVLPEPFSGKSVPLDIGFSSHIPDTIRRGVIARAAGHCEWPGGCDRPAAASDVHHIRHRKDGGPTSVAGCLLLCGFHHDVAVHRWGWGVDLQADGTITATSPDGAQVIRGHPNRGSRYVPDRRPPPRRAA